MVAPYGDHHFRGRTVFRVGRQIKFLCDASKALPWMVALGCVQGTSLRHPREMWVTSLLWTQFCLENGCLHRRPPFAIFLNNSDWLKRFFKMAASIHGLPFKIKTTILIGWTSGHFRGAFCRLFLHSQVGGASESTLRWTLNAALVPGLLSQSQSY